jgi:carbamoyl-phosphate synthase large subunit
MEHVERTGVHSGDSIGIYPHYSLPDDVVEKLLDYSTKITRALHISGLVNIQYCWDGKDIYVIEVNPRASRTVPILSKVTGVPMVHIALDIMMGKKLAELGYGTGYYAGTHKCAVKVPVFSDAKLTDVDVAVGPEMKSTGEVLGIDADLNKAIYKGFLAANTRIPTEGGVYVSLRDHDKTKYTADILKTYADEGFKLYASSGTAKFMSEYGIDAEEIAFDKVAEKIGNDIRMLINVPKAINAKGTDTFPLRRKAIEHGLPVLTCVDTAWAFMIAIKEKKSGTPLSYDPVEFK